MRQKGAVSSVLPALCPPGFSVRIAGRRSALPLLPLRGVAGGFSVAPWLPPVLLGRNGTFLGSHPCLLPRLLDVDVRHREVLPEALVRGEDEPAPLSDLGKQKGAEGLQLQELFGFCSASGSSGK